MVGALFGRASAAVERPLRTEEIKREEVKKTTINLVNDNVVISVGEIE